MVNEDRTRVALISPVGAIGGAERVLMELARGLLKRQFHPRIFCLREGTFSAGGWGTDIEIAANAGGYRIRHPWTLLRTTRWLRQQLVSFQPTIVHANHASWWLTALASHGIDATKIWHIYDYPDRRDLPTRIGVRLQPSAVIVTSAHFLEGYPELRPLPHAVIPPVAVDVTNRSDLPHSDAVLRNRNIDGPYVLTVSRWQPHKGLHLLPDICRRLVDPPHSLKDLRFVVVGTPSNPSERKYKSRVEREIKASGLEDVIRCVDNCDESELRGLYASATLYMHLASSEGFGLTILEAMATGVPVVAFDASGPREILQGGRGGTLVPVGDCHALAANVAQLIDQEQSRSAIGTEGRKRAGELTKDRMIEQTVAFYSELISTSG